MWTVNRLYTSELQASGACGRQLQQVMDRFVAKTRSLSHSTSKERTGKDVASTSKMATDQSQKPEHNSSAYSLHYSLQKSEKVYQALINKVEDMENWLWQNNLIFVGLPSESFTVGMMLDIWASAIPQKCLLERMHFIGPPKPWTQLTESSYCQIP